MPKWINKYSGDGSLSANEERFMRWRTIDGEVVDPLGKHRELETLIKGMFTKEIFLSYPSIYTI